jgi:hypothetical protein
LTGSPVEAAAEGAPTLIHWDEIPEESIGNVDPIVPPILG